MPFVNCAWARECAPRLSYASVSIIFTTSINHKGLQRTANEYAEERRIYKDLISKNNNVDILNSASRILQQDMNTTPKELKIELLCLVIYTKVTSVQNKIVRAYYFKACTHRFAKI